MSVRHSIVMAPPSKLTDDVQDHIVRLIRAGLPIELAGQVAGVSRSSVYGWIARGASTSARDRPYREFAQAMERARAEGEAVLVARIQGAAHKGSWRAAAFLLERRFPERWARGGAAGDDERDGSAAGPFDELDRADELSARRARRPRDDHVGA